MVPDLPSAVPLITRLPGVFQEDPFVQRFVAAFDDALAPVLTTLDGLDAYVDPALAPADFLDWVAQWVGLDLDQGWPLQQRRDAVAGAALLHRRRGTLPGVADAVRLAVGPTVDGPAADVQVRDSGGTAWSTSCGTAMPGRPEAALEVVVTAADPAGIDVRRLQAVVASVKPAHVPHTVQVVGAAPDAPREPEEEPC